MDELILIKNDIQEFAVKAKKMTLESKDIIKLKNLTDNISDVESRISLLQFCLRYIKRGKLNANSFAKRIGESYYEAYKKEINPLKKFQFFSWAKRYGFSIQDKRLIKDLNNKIISAKTQSEYITLLNYLDGFYTINFNTNSIIITIDNFQHNLNFEKVITPQKVFISPINSQLYRFNHKFTNFEISGITHNGNKSKNDDNLLCVQFETKELVIAIADGSGNSNNANLVSRIALESFLFAFVNTKNFDKSIYFSSASVRNFNLKQKLDGETTVSILFINENYEGIALSIGDSPYVIIDDNSVFFDSGIRPGKRGIIGSEPLGNVITSSANVLYKIVEETLNGKIYIDRISSFLIASDGIILNNEFDFRRIKNLLRKKGTYNVCDAIVERSLASFDDGETPRDNVSVIYGSFF